MGCLAPGGSNRQRWGVALCLQGASPALLTPRTCLPAQDCLLQGESLLLNFFFPKRSPVPISMDSLASRAAARWGGVEQLKFSKEGEPQLVLTLRKGGQPPGLILAPLLGHRHHQLQSSFYSRRLRWNWQFHSSRMTNWRTVEKQ